ncbi:MAG: hypothetical protein Q9166_003944 [cf. Caloplaca sp. 2 TL-2023]
MSFLNSVLNTIGGDGGPIPQTQPQPRAQSHSRPELQTDTNTTSSERRTPFSQPSAPTAGRKRKAEDSLPAPKAKALRGDEGQKPTEEASLSARLPLAKQLERPTVATSKSALAVPYRGTSRPSPTSASPETLTTAAAKAAPPKKGSYADILARAAANKTPLLGVIKHKPKDTISAKKEILMRKKGILPNGKGRVQDARNGEPGRNSDSPVQPTAYPKSPSLSGKKPHTQPSYKGTAAPKPQPSYKGTMNSGSSIENTARRKDLKNDWSRSSSLNPLRRSRGYESEDEEDEIDDEEDGYSDESDNMEAGFSDVEEEETAAAKAARKEDEEQLRIENQLKKEKEDRKKRLAAMAAKAPKPKY